MILVTGGAGFIGSNFVYQWLDSCDEPVCVLDKLTYAANPATLDAACATGRVSLHRLDIGELDAVAALLASCRPRAIFHFAAESHVDRSIHGPEAFVQTNVVGTFRLLEASRQYWRGLEAPQRDAFRFVHVSTDEVYGSLGPQDAAFTERTAYAPNSPYAASKAASDHMVRAYHETYGLPTLTTNCSNNYGPWQFPEKLIPLMILNALAGKPLPVYGDGGQVRDWLHVSDHCAALRRVLADGKLGNTYNIGGQGEVTNLDIVGMICDTLQRRRPRENAAPYRGLISFVADRPGHDRRYAVDARKIREELGWQPTVSLAQGLQQTVDWYLGNADWVDQVQSGAYRAWIQTNYGGRQ